MSALILERPTATPAVEASAMRSLDELRAWARTEAAAAPALSENQTRQLRILFTEGGRAK